VRRKLIAAAGALAGLAVFCLGAWHLEASPDPLADLKASAAALDARNYAVTLASSAGLAKRLPKLADYAAWLEASAQFALGNLAAVPAALDTVWMQTPASPLAARAYILDAQALIRNAAAKDAGAKQAVDLLRKNYAALPQPHGDLLLAQAFAASGDPVSAAIYNQRAYYGYPLSAEASPADAELARLRTALGANYPPALSNAMLSRALKLLDAGQIQAARKELESMVSQLGGADRDLARVRIGVADYDAQDTAAADRELTALESLAPPALAPEADAERLYYLVQCARRLNNQEELDQALDRISRLYPNSPWRLQALLVAANRYLITNQSDAYEPLYRACYETFPKNTEAPGCHWHVVWSHYLRRSADAADLLRQHLRLFPSADSASAALYFLGRLAEGAQDSSAARTYYSEIAGQYPNQYYATLARDRLAKAGPAAESVAVNEFLRSVAFTERARVKNFNPAPATAARLERASLLQQAGLVDWAEQELRFAARTAANSAVDSDVQPYVIALQLASLLSAKPDQSLHAIKSYAGGYLFLPLDSAPRQFWTFAFPLPFRSDLETFSKQNGLDPFLVAALIRQESEFNPQAVSKAGARGLTQIEPATGRDLSRRLKLTTYSTAGLFQPRLNLQLGTYYLKMLLGSVGGREDAALAAYDGGLTHVRAWLTWGDFRESAEFIETIPFDETRGYVQGVLRNADIYRRLYGAQPVDRAAH
jgi:soluble lytic murein transglycosylase